ncbi:MAG TPA: GTP-binding protein [Verrucomicrobiae bacterium]|nr:GTP-binding protein [Verrucomicrobiae bacterium]
MKPNKPNQTDSRIPVTILTGFLGSGKTTLLNRILTENHGKRIAVIENEFGEIGIDDALVVQADEEIFEMNNGCICCTVRGDLIRILGNLMKRRNKFDYVLVETTGLADPGPVAQTFFVDEEVKDSYRLDGIVTLVDSRHVWQHIGESDECKAQIAFADKILVNKTDLASEADVQKLEQRLKTMNRLAHVHRTQQAQLPIAEVINIRAFDLAKKLEVDADFLKPELPFEWSGVYELAAGAHELVFQPGPDPLIGCVVMPIANFNIDSIGMAQKRAVNLFSSSPQAVSRGGVVSPGERLYALRLDAITTTFQLPVAQAGGYAVFTQHMPEEFDFELQRQGQKLTPVLSEAHAAGHTHDDTVTSVGICVPGELVEQRLETWLSETLRTRGADIFRMKGILNIQGSPNRFVFQGVHMLFDGKPDRPWQNGEDRTNQLVFIGRNLNREALNAGFKRCLAV